MNTIDLEEINGIRPKRLLADGEEIEVPSQTTNAKYKIKRTHDHYYCTCPAWRLGAGPVNARTCKHLKFALGSKYEEARLKAVDPHGQQHGKAAQGKGKGKAAAASGSTQRVTRATAKKRVASDDDADDEGDSTAGRPQRKKHKSSASKPPTPPKAPAVLLATKWDVDAGIDPTGWWVSEKLDGVRVYFDGTRMLSRNGNMFTPPAWFLKGLPKNVTLDGELFAGRGKFKDTVSIVKTYNSPHWKDITFQIFDVPSKEKEPFEERVAYLKKTFGPSGTHFRDHVVVVDQIAARDRQHVLDLLKDVEGKGGEGLMLRQPRSLYEGTRSATLQKVKTFYDAEAKVIGYVSGKGKYAGSTGALKCVMESGKTFSVGSGLSDRERRNPPKVGSIIVYRFQELSASGSPRFPTYVGQAIDKDKPKDAELPEHRKGGGD